MRQPELSHLVPSVPACRRSSRSLLEQMQLVSTRLVTRRQLADAEGSPRARSTRLIATGLLDSVPPRRLRGSPGAPHLGAQALLGRGAGRRRRRRRVSLDRRRGSGTSATARRLGFEITVPRAATSRGRRACASTRSAILDADDVSRRDGVPCTSFERTLCDSTTQLVAGSSSAACSTTDLRRKVTTLDRLRACVAAARLGAAPAAERRAGSARAARRGYDPGGSDAELRLLRVLERRRTAAAGAAASRCASAAAPYDLDFAWPDVQGLHRVLRAAVAHRHAEAVAYDSERITRPVERRLAAAHLHRRVDRRRDRRADHASCSSLQRARSVDEPAPDARARS